MGTVKKGPDADVQVLHGAERIAALLPPVRRQLVTALLEQADSAAGLARRLGETRQRLTYHLRALENAGVLELDSQRRRGNCVERIMRVAARGFVLDPAVLGGLGAEPELGGDRYSAAYLIALAARTIREVAALRQRGVQQEKRTAVAVMDAEIRLANPASYDAFREDLAVAVAEVISRHHDAGTDGRVFRVFAGMHQRPPETHDDGGNDEA